MCTYLFLLAVDIVSECDDNGAVFLGHPSERLVVAFVSNFTWVNDCLSPVLLSCFAGIDQLYYYVTFRRD